jgi:hypothetical protein
MMVERMMVERMMVERMMVETEIKLLVATVVGCLAAFPTTRISALRSSAQL